MTASGVACSSLLSLETLANLILEELRLIRNDMKEEVRKLGVEIKHLHSVDDTGSNDQFKKTFNRSFSNSSLKNDVKEENRSCVLPVDEGVDDDDDDDDDGDDDAAIKAVSILKKPGNCFSQKNVSHKPPKHSLGDIVHMLKNKNIKIKEEGTNVDDVEPFGSLEKFQLSIDQCRTGTFDKNSDLMDDNKSNAIALPFQEDSAFAPNAATSSSSDIASTSIANESLPLSDVNEHRFDNMDNRSQYDELNGEIQELCKFGSNLSTQASVDQLIEAETNFICKYCQKPFRHFSTYQSHLRTHTGEKPFVCKICNKTYTQKGNLTKHMLLHTDEKPFECEMCGKRFAQKTYLVNHIRTHTGERPFACHICNKRFAQRGNLSKHVMLHRNIKNHVCPMCGKRYVQSHSLKIHMRSHTGEKPFSCQLCPKTFAQNSYLKQHCLRFHEKVRYPCHICDKEFANKHNLNQHLNRHMKNKIYVCDICKKSFKMRESLIAHQLVHNMS